ncbi:MAG: peptidoglycan DD-metalloendopeptidase family protein, partial [Myxococcota bacterium]
RADWEGELATMFAAYDDLEAEIGFVRQAITANDAEVLPLIGLAPRVEWSLAVTGLPAGGGAREDVLISNATFDGDQELFWIESAGRRRFVGNGFAEPFSIDLPILPGQGARVTFGLWPFGVHGGGHPEGHPGWDIEYAANAPVRAAADGEVVSIEDNDAGPGQKDIEIRHRPGRSTVYHHVVDLEPGLAPGVAVGRGDELGVAADFGGGHRVIHFSLRSSIDDVCPLGFLSAAGQAVFDATWPDAAYVEELTEPFPCNPIGVALPLVRTWTLDSGALPAAIELTRTDPTTQAYTYRLLDGDASELETGDVTNVQPIAAADWGWLDLEPDGGGAAHLALYRIVGDTLEIDWGAVRPADLSSASVYGTTP